MLCTRYVRHRSRCPFRSLLVWEGVCDCGQALGATHTIIRLDSVHASDVFGTDILSRDRVVHILVNNSKLEITGDIPQLFKDPRSTN